MRALKIYVPTQSIKCHILLIKWSWERYTCPKKVKELKTECRCSMHFRLCKLVICFVSSNAFSCVEGNAVKDLTKVHGNEILPKIEYIIYYVRNKNDECLKYTAQ